MNDGGGSWSTFIGAPLAFIDFIVLVVYLFN